MPESRKTFLMIQFKRLRRTKHNTIDMLIERVVEMSLPALLLKNQPNKQRKIRRFKKTLPTLSCQVKALQDEYGNTLSLRVSEGGTDKEPGPLCL